MGNMPICKSCGVELNSENWSPSSSKRKYYCCKSCVYKKVRKWTLDNWERAKKYSREYQRTHRLTVNGGVLWIKKRPRPNLCELCKKEFKRLSYHHWDDNNPQFGLWLCIGCHNFAERLEMGLEKRYNDLKQKVCQP